jgi:hypothetical protein
MNLSAPLFSFSVSSRPRHTSKLFASPASPIIIIHPHLKPPWIQISILLANRRRVSPPCPTKQLAYLQRLSLPSLPISPPLLFRLLLRQRNHQVKQSACDRYKVAVVSRSSTTEKFADNQDKWYIQVTHVSKLTHDQQRAFLGLSKNKIWAIIS